MKSNFLFPCARLALVCGALASASVAAAQESVRLSALPSAEMTRGQRPLAAAQGFNAANARAAVAPQRRMATRTVAVTRTRLLPPPAPGAAQAEALQYRASGMRIIGGASLDRLRAVLTPAEQQAAGGLLTVSNAVEERQLARFVGQTTQFVSVEGDSAIVGWWHALDDAWIISRWRRDSAGWRIATMGALTGADLLPAAAPATGDTPLEWPRKISGLATALESQNQNGIRNFMAAVRRGNIDALLTDARRQTRAWKAIRERRALQEAILARTAQSPGYADIRRIVAEAVTGKAAQNSTRMARQRLNALPANARASLRPVMAVQERGGKTFLVQSPLAPAFLIFVQAQDPAPAATTNQSARAAGFDVFSLWVRDSQ